MGGGLEKPQALPALLSRADGTQKGPRRAGPRALRPRGPPSQPRRVTVGGFSEVGGLPTDRLDRGFSTFSLMAPSTRSSFLEAK